MPQQTSEFDDTNNETTRAGNRDRERTATPSVIVQLHQDHKAPGGGPRANKQVKWVSLSEATTQEEYANHQVLARVRYPEAINAEYFNPGSPGSIIDGERLIVLEHNGWVDPDSESDPPAVLPPTDQACTVEVARDKALAAEEVTYAVALKEARTDAARSIVESTHAKAVAKIEAECKRNKVTRTEACCFWDAISQEEVILIIRSINLVRGKVLGLLLETKPT